MKWITRALEWLGGLMKKPKKPQPVPAPAPAPTPVPVTDTAPSADTTTAVTTGSDPMYPVAAARPKTVVSVTPVVVPDSSGWTTITAIEPSGEGTSFSGAGTRKLYVDSGAADDSGTGTEASPFKSRTAARTHMRDGYPDHMYLKRGGVWTDKISIKINGKSATELMLFGAYGSASDPLPKIKLLKGGSNAAFEAFTDGGAVNYLAFRDMEICAPDRDPDDAAWDTDAVLNSQPAGISISGLSTSDGILFEGLYIHHCMIGINFTTGTPDGTTLRKNVKFRRNIIVKNYANTTTHPQSGTGILIGDMDPTTTNFLFEENTFDHNGWMSDYGVANTSTTGNTRGLYIQVGSGAVPSPKPVIRNNFYIRDGSGPAFRAGGTIYNNAFYGNPWSITTGFPTASVHEISYNVVTNAVPSTFNNLGYGIVIDGTSYDGLSLSVGTMNLHHNIVAHNNSTNPFRAINLLDSSNNTIANNLVDDWSGDTGAPYEDGTSSNNTKTGNLYGGTYSDNARTLASYASSIGLTGTVQAFVDAQVAQRRTGTAWAANLTANGYNNYIRAGYDQAAV